MVGSQHQYRFFNVNNVLFDIPSNVYDDSVVDGWFRNIAREGQKLDKWVILSIPDKSLTITHTAASQLCSRLPFLRTYGCLGFLLLANHVNAKIFQHSLRAPPPILIYKLVSRWSSCAVMRRRCLVMRET